MILIKDDNKIFLFAPIHPIKALRTGIETGTINNIITVLRNQLG